MSEPTGTANILHQFTAYSQLRKDYSSEVANTLTQKNLARHNIPATPDDVDAWYRINTAAASSKLDIPTERSVADALANAAVATILQVASAPASVDLQKTISVTDDEDLDEDDEVEGYENELPSLADIYGYENDEDNEEAALDDILKAQEQAD